MTNKSATSVASTLPMQSDSPAALNPGLTTGTGHAPKHVAFIVDGNRRWANAHEVPLEEGHRRGAENICRALEWCEAAGVQITTWWLLSTDNLNRSPCELHKLVDIIGGLVRTLAASRRWQIRHLGDAAVLPTRLAAEVEAAVESSCDGRRPQVNLAIGYSGRADIVAAVRSLAVKAAAMHDAGLPVEVTERQLAEALSTRGQPDPDLVIRTSGEHRLSGFMAWQTSLSELHFCPALWPDFRRSHFEFALTDYARRKRRFGT